MTGCRVVCLHSAFGLTEGVHEFADLLRAEGCEVVTPDFYAGLTFDTVAEGVAHRDEIGYRELYARVADLDVEGAVLVGFSLGASFAQRLAGPGVRLVALIGSLDPLRPGDPWCGVDVQLHQLADDPWVDDEDVPAFRARCRNPGRCSNTSSPPVRATCSPNTPSANTTASSPSSPSIGSLRICPERGRHVPRQDT